MGKFLESEKIKQTAFKNEIPYYSNEARKDGEYKGKLRPFCLPVACADQNLFPEIREQAILFFAMHGIKWHDGSNGKPSNHLCDSQVCCVNFLYPFFDKPVQLAQILKPVFPDLETMLPVEDGQFVSFEWIGQKNYLGERISRNGQRTRGANCTSADAIVMFERGDKKKQVVLIEWKYTESYGGTNLKISRNGTDRTAIYRPWFNNSGCPIDKRKLPDFEALFFEPFYQFMRQQFLANEMEKAHELGADLVSVLHIAPARNTDFRTVTSPRLKGFGESATEVWKNLVKEQGKFISVSTESLFSAFPPDSSSVLGSWLEYIQTRYSWIRHS